MVDIYLQNLSPVQQEKGLFTSHLNPKFINSNLHVAVHGNYLTWSFASYMSIVFLNQLHVLSTYLTTYCIGCGLILVLVKNFFRPVYFFSNQFDSFKLVNFF